MCSRMFAVTVIAVLVFSLFGAPTTFAQEAGVISINENTSGFLEAGEVEYWSVSASALEQAIIIGHSDDFDIVLTLYHDDIPVASDDDGFGELDAAFITVFTGSLGNYYLAVSAFNSSSSGAYELSMQPGLFYGQHISHTSRNRTSDNYAFYGYEGDQITLLLHSDDFDAVLGLYNRYGQIAVDDNSWVEAGSQTDARIDLVIPANGVYFIDVNSTGTALNGSYLLSIWPTLHQGQVIRGFLPPQGAHVFHIMGQSNTRLYITASSDIQYRMLDLIIYGHGVSDEQTGEYVSLDLTLPYPDHSIEVRASGNSSDSGWYELTVFSLTD